MLKTGKQREEALGDRLRFPPQPSTPIQIVTCNTPGCGNTVRVPPMLAGRPAYCPGCLAAGKTPRKW